MELLNEEEKLMTPQVSQKFKKKTMIENMKHVRKLITVEPSVILYIIPNTIVFFTVQNFYLDKSCRVDLGYNETVCDALRSKETDSFKDEEMEIEQLIASIGAWKNFVQAAVPAILILFVGAWSDRTGFRKPCLLIPIIGDLISFVGNIAFSTVLYNTPIHYLAIFECFFPGLGGRWVIFLLGVYSYIADVTTEKQRTIRVGAANICMTFSVPLGTAMSAVVLKWAGFTVLYSMCLVMNILTLLYVYFILQESPLRAQVLARQKSQPNRNKSPSFFGFAQIKETFTVVFFRGTVKRRIKCILILLITCFVYGPQQGEAIILIFYTRLKLNWNEIWFSMFNTYITLVHVLGNLFSLSVLSGKLKFEDSTVGIISSISKMFSNLIYAFANLSWHLYFAAVVDMFNGTSYIALRSIASKIVPSDELGKLFSVFGFIEALMPMILQPAYLKIYELTLKTFPGADYVCSALLTFTAALAFIYFYVDAKENRTRVNVNKEKNTSLRNIM